MRTARTVILNSFQGLAGLYNATVGRAKAEGFAGFAF